MKPPKPELDGIVLLVLSRANIQQKLAAALGQSPHLSRKDYEVFGEQQGLSQAAGDEEPAARVFAGEGSLLSKLRADFEAHGLEGFDFPAIGKGMA